MRGVNDKRLLEGLRPGDRVEITLTRVEYNPNQYPNVYAEEVSKTVRQVFGEVAACKVAHCQKLARNVSEEELNGDYRSEQALTVALMGLMLRRAS